jgi:uncharacterized protein (DUF302 family)
MQPYARRMVLDLKFEEALGLVNRTIRDEGLQAIARIDVREHFWRTLQHDFRQYVLIDAWSPELALEALRLDLDAGTAFHTTFAVYELADGETAVIVKYSPSSAPRDDRWRHDTDGLAALLDREHDRVSRVMQRLELRSPGASNTAPIWAA